MLTFKHGARGKHRPHVDQLLVTLSSFVGNAGQVRVPLFTVLSDHAAVVVRVLTQETLGVVVAVDVDLGQCIVGGRLLAAFVDARLQPRQQQLQPVRVEESGGIRIS